MVFKELEIEKSKIDFRVLYKITKINVDKITLRKYEINRSLSEKSENMEIIGLGKEIGEIIFQIKPEVAVEVLKMIGEVIKDFKVELVGKKRKKGMIMEIIKV